MSFQPADLLSMWQDVSNHAETSLSPTMKKVKDQLETQLLAALAPPTVEQTPDQPQPTKES